jgi:hypothetical protein
VSLRIRTQVQAMPRPPNIRKSLRSLSVAYRGVRKCRLLSTPVESCAVCAG